MASGLQDKTVTTAQPAQAREPGTLFAVELHAAEGYSSRLADVVRAEARELGIDQPFRVDASRGFLVAGLSSVAEAERAARELLAEPIVQRIRVRAVDDPGAHQPEHAGEVVWHVLPRPGVTDPEAESALAAMHVSGLPATAVRTFRRYEFAGLSAEAL
jgi:phosphoribosylformylglycinamidine synthase subunit PurSL